jgi:endonuclease G
MSREKSMKHILLALLFTINSAWATNCDHMVPYGKPVVTTSEAIIYLCRQLYVVEYSVKRKTPYWSAELVQKDGLLIKEPRVNAFRADPDLAKGQSAIPEDYTNTGYDKGHMSPVGDMHINSSAMLESFYMTNMVPQDPGNNRAGWRELEEYIRELVISRGQLFVITGPVYDTETPKTIGKNKVAVPTRLYKIVVDLQAKTSMSFIVANAPFGITEIEKHLTTIAEIEKVTGIKFFPASSVLLKEATTLWGSRTN